MLRACTSSVTARAGVGFFVALLSTLAGCSLAFDYDAVQCESAADCSALGVENGACVDGVCVANEGAAGGGGSGGQGAGGSGGDGGSPVDPRWACVEGFQEPEPEGDLIHLYKFESAVDPETPLQNLQIKLCQIFEPDCETVIDMPVADATGAVELSLSPSFDGYLSVTADGLMPSFVLLQKPVVIPQTQKVIRMASQAVLTSLAAAQGATYDPMKGVTIVLAVDCSDERAPGVTIHSAQADADPDATPFYFKNDIPDISATETDEQGAGGYLNLPIELIVYTIKFGTEGNTLTGTEIGSATFTARAGAITYVPVGPTE